MMAMLVVAMALLCMVRAGDSFQQDEIGLIAMIKEPFRVVSVAIFHGAALLTDSAVGVLGTSLVSSDHC